MSRILRTLVCLLLICCMLVNLSPLKAEASAAGAVLGITKVASVSVPALWPIVAALAVVGVTAYGVESGAFKALAEKCYTDLDTAGDWIKDGYIEILRSVDSNGGIQYYLPGSLLNAINTLPSFSDVRQASNAGIVPSGSSISYNGYKFECTAPVQVYYTYSDWGNGSYDLNVSLYSATGFSCKTTSPSGTLSQSSSSAYGKAWVCNKTAGTVYTKPTGIPVYEYYSVMDYCSSHVVASDSSLLNALSGLSVGYLPSEDVELDDATIVTFHPYLANVIRTRTGDSGGSGDDENKWWLAVAYAETLEKLYQTSQQAQIETPSVTEIPDLQEGTQYEVTIETDEDGNERYVLSPIYNPGTGTDPGTGDGSDTDPDTGTDSGNGSGNTGTDSGNTGNTGSSWKPPSDHSQFALADLSKFFPFCIPFDLFDLFKLLNADPVAPSFTWEIQDLSGQTYGLTVDLSQWDSVAQLFRRLQLFLFVCGLAAASRKFIKW